MNDKTKRIPNWAHNGYDGSGRWELRDLQNNLIARGTVSFCERHRQQNANGTLNADKRAEIAKWPLIEEASL
jgi:hypothetical protein